MKSGKVIEAGPTKEIMTNPKDPYTMELLRTAFASMHT
jgi:ABC-type dipeptide/oligopeptide/nickel transport system ATPase component